MKNKKPIVLVVEDEKPLQDAIKMKLEKNDFDVVTARSVEQAMNFMDDIEKIDIIWLDHYLLGQENGLDFVAKAKNNKKWKKIPIFVVSNTATVDKIKTYLELGVEKYYTKSDHKLDNIIESIKKSLKR